MATKRPRIIAHRGASRERPENTVAAFARAVELGADAVELDLHLTADGALVVHHDALLADGRAIAALLSVDLEAVRVRGEPIPQLEQVFAAVPGVVTVHCELKGLGTAAPTLTRIGGTPAGRATVHSFDHRMMAEARTLDPKVPRGVLEVSYPVDGLSAARSVDARDLWRHWEFIDAMLVEAAHAEGRRVIAWTVNDAAVMQRFAALGVDGICTDDVALAVRALAS